MIDEISLIHFLTLAVILFVIGVAGLLMNRKNVISILMSIELMLLAVNINLGAFSVYQQEISGQIFSIIILTIAAAETSIGLAILVLHFRNGGSIEVDSLNQMRE